MISARRIVSLFHQTGGGDEFTKSAEGLTDEQHAFVCDDLQEERSLIAGILSTDHWFAITSRQLVVKNHNELHRISLENIEWVVAQDNDYKLRGGELGIKLRDGSTISIRLTSGRSYVSMMNVLMYIGRVTGPSSGRGLASSPTTNDRRPTTQL